jgi:hypothetical protein
MEPEAPEEDAAAEGSLEQGQEEPSVLGNSTDVKVGRPACANWLEACDCTLAPIPLNYCLPSINTSSVCCCACPACGSGAHTCLLCNQVVVRVRPQVLGIELQQGMITCIGAMSCVPVGFSYSSSTATISCVLVEWGEFRQFRGRCCTE